MKIFSYFMDGAFRSLKAWKWLLLIWVADLFLASFLTLTLRGEMNQIFGKSLITERLTESSIVDAFANTGNGLQILISSFRTGFYLCLLIGLIINAFLNAGLFTTLRNIEKKANSTLFFTGASANFWSFLVISLLSTLMLVLSGFIIIGIPLLAAYDSAGDYTLVILKITFLVMLIILPVFLLVCDYARSWQVSSDRKNAFKALGMGFRITFRQFFASWSVMLILVIIQLIYTFFVIRITGALRPLSGGGIFLMFVLIQLLFIIKLYLRTWRYGTVISMYEKQGLQC